MIGTLRWHARGKRHRLGPRGGTSPMTTDRCYFVSSIRAPSPRKGWLLADEATPICEFFTQSAALTCARSLARLDCASGHNAAVYEILPLGQVVLKWRCMHGQPMLADTPGEPVEEPASPADPSPTPVTR